MATSAPARCTPSRKSSAVRTTRCRSTPDNVLGILSLFFWSLIIVVTLKYVSFIMRANNKGEGGIIALMALALHKGEPGRTRQRLLIAARPVRRRAVLRRRRDHAGDLGALGGRGAGAGHAGFQALHPADHAGILVGLFLVPAQRHGQCRRPVRPGDAALVRRAGRCSARSASSQHPAVLAARQPAACAALSCSAIRLLGFFALGAVVLCITGAEALYADMGHFGARPIQYCLARATCCRRCCSTTSARVRCCWPIRRPIENPVLPAGAGMGAAIRW